MRQIYHRYELWEDYQAGMYGPCVNEYESINNAIFLLSSSLLFDSVCSDVIENWKICAAVNLTNKSTNRRSWLGQAAACYKFGVPELITRKAWSKLSDETKKQANIIAENHIIKYERANYRLHTNMGAPMLF